MNPEIRNLIGAQLASLYDAGMTSLPLGLVELLARLCVAEAMAEFRHLTRDVGQLAAVDCQLARQRSAVTQASCQWCGSRDKGRTGSGITATSRAGRGDPESCQSLVDHQTFP